MTPNKEKELRNHLKTLDKDQLIELLLQFKCDAELLQGVENDTLDAMNEKLVLEKALELLIGSIEYESCFYCPCGKIGCCEGSGKKCSTYVKDYFIEQARDSLKNEKT